MIFEHLWIINVITVQLVQNVKLFPKMLEQSVPYVMLNRYAPGCTSYDSKTIMIGICHISGTENLLLAVVWSITCSVKVIISTAQLEATNMKLK